MVYYYRSGNVKMLRNIINDYDQANEITPHEYMKTYIEKCPETTDDSKLSWIAETFLSIQRHREFLKAIANHLSEELSQEEQEYFIIILHAIIFQIVSKDMQYLYKSLFNLCKPLLNTFTKFLSNNEVLAFISQVAQVYYDTNYITEKIIGPLFEWQPYISEMAHSYIEHVNKTESRKLKPPTVPIQPNVLNRKSKDYAAHIQNLNSICTPPNSIHSKKKNMLTKNTIDKKLKQIHEKNKEKAARLLNDVKNQNFHYAQVAKSDKYLNTVNNIKNEKGHPFSKSFTSSKANYTTKPIFHVKENAATVKRLNKRIQMEEEEEALWLQNVICFRNTAKIEEIAEQDRQEKERERLLDIERKHLLGLISHEESVLAKNKLIEDNKKKYEEFLKEKQSWNEEIEKWQKLETEKNRKQIEKQSLIELNILQAKNEISMKKKDTAEKVKKETEVLFAKAMREKQEELERKIRMIKEIKILEIIAKKAKVPKIIDLTESSRLGLLCEMSIAELQERLVAMKIELTDELKKKKKLIFDEKQAAKRQLEETKTTVKNYLEEQAQMRLYNKKINNPLNINRSSSKDIDDLKKILEEKRAIRLKLNNIHHKK